MPSEEPPAERPAGPPAEPPAEDLDAVNQRCLRTAERWRWVGQGGAVVGVLGVAAATAVPDLPRDGTVLLVGAALVFVTSAVVGAVAVVRAERLRGPAGEADEAGQGTDPRPSGGGRR